MDSNWNTSIILDEDKQLEINDSHEKISDEYEIYYSKSLDANVCFEKEMNALETLNIDG